MSVDRAQIESWIERELRPTSIQGGDEVQRMAIGRRVEDVLGLAKLVGDKVEADERRTARGK